MPPPAPDSARRAELVVEAMSAWIVAPFAVTVLPAGRIAWLEISALLIATATPMPTSPSRSSRRPAAATALPSARRERVGVGGGREREASAGVDVIGRDRRARDGLGEVDRDSGRDIDAARSRSTRSASLRAPRADPPLRSTSRRRRCARPRPAVDAVARCAARRVAGSARGRRASRSRSCPTSRARRATPRRRRRGRARASTRLRWFAIVRPSERPIAAVGPPRRLPRSRRRGGLIRGRGERAGDREAVPAPTSADVVMFERAIATSARS